MTVYTSTARRRRCRRSSTYESDRFEHLDYTEAQFKTEAGAILGEYAKSASDPEEKLDEKMAETAYTKHTYRHTVIGYLDDIKNMPSGYAYSREFFRRYYTPDNATVIVAGDFDKKATLAHIEKVYAGWKGKLDAAQDPRRAAADRSRAPRTSTGRRRRCRGCGWHGTRRREPAQGRRRAQNVLNGYLFGPTSTLYQDLVLGRQLVDSMDADLVATSRSVPRSACSCA